MSSADTTTSRLRVLSGAAVLVSLLLCAKLVQVQAFHGQEFAERADRQYARPPGASFSRGLISFEDKDGQLVSAATLKSGFILAVIPPKVSDPAALYAKLADIVDIERDLFI